ncbi:hypothetical protein [Tautonia sociabilis]|uniref:Uncharacterized protein n=1 Tax=Tautonia sociabilis TaxID=2080755 RepID=A0A432MP09_9BACT|nr:hypothetical protein [Tautonia sociabilis]RUL88808.1 hypothetical protein TsocGM_05475 [Tautonia sociabilis]
MTKRAWISLAGVGLAAVVSWTVAVDSVRIEEDCLDCQLSRTIERVRVASAVVAESIRERPSLISMVADDLGAPCPHDRVHRWESRRRLGLVLTVVDEPVLYPVQRPWYPPCAREGARSLAAAEDGLSSEFRARVLEAHDWAYWARLRDRVYDACPPEQRPEALADPGDQAPSADGKEAGEPSATGDDPAGCDRSSD